MLPQQNPIMVPTSFHGINTAPLDASAAFPQFFGVNPQLPPQAQFSQSTGVAPIHPLAYVTGDGTATALSNLADLGFTEDVIMSDHWMSLMRQAGIFDNHATLTTTGAPPPQMNGNPSVWGNPAVNPAVFATQSSMF